MIQFSTKYRSSQSEIMDDLELQGPEMKEVLTDLNKVNKLLGGNSITIGGLRKLLKGWPIEEQLTILDLGCGDGEILRKCAEFGKSEGFNFRLIGIDANAFILEEAKNKSQNFKNITFIKLDVFSQEFKELDYDIALCTLFLHHFKTLTVKELLNDLTVKAKVGVIINDLHRSRVAYWLFKLFSNVILKSRIAKYDGLVSIARGFKKKELVQLSGRVDNCVSHIRWKWAFRYQWLIIRN